MPIAKIVVQTIVIAQMNVANAVKAGRRRDAVQSSNGQSAPIAISAAVVILAVTALVCAGLVAVPLWTALVRDWQVDAISDRHGVAISC